jgi:hypothetical protein
MMIWSSHPLTLDVCRVYLLALIWLKHASVYFVGISWAIISLCFKFCLSAYSWLSFLIRKVQYDMLGILVFHHIDTAYTHALIFVYFHYVGIIDWTLASLMYIFLVFRAIFSSHFLYLFIFLESIQKFAYNPFTIHCHTFFCIPLFKLNDKLLLWLLFGPINALENLFCSIWGMGMAFEIS